MVPADPPEPPIETDPRPVVALPRPGLPGAVIAGVAAILALLLFLMLNAHRLHRETPRAQGQALGDAFPAPPPLTVPPEPPPVAMLPPEPPRPEPPRAPVFPTYVAPVVPPATPPVAASQSVPQAPRAVARRRSDDAALVYDDGKTRTGAGGTAAAAAASADDTPIQTSVIGNHTTVMPTGTVIPAVLETPIDSTRPGLVRALVSEDARGFDGRRVLIPRGSRLIGDYASDIRSGQKRVLVNWSRLIRPDGVAIRIGSPAADPLGGAGIPGKVDTFFFQRFASAVLQSALAVGVNLASRPGNGSVIVGLPNASTGVIGQDLIPSADLKPRIRVKQGSVLTIFVAHDLDFGGTPPVGPDRPQ